MKIAVRAAAGLAALVVVSSASAQEDLARKHNCFACHALDKKVVGPSYKQVAEKYRGDKTAAAKLFDKVKKGGSGVWGPVPMPANPQVPDADLERLIAWILSLK
ncbi:MAG TPA: c-type cytochrome [Burkholderiales bacterium]